MSIAIESVTPHTPAARAGLRAGDRLLSINGNVIRDVLDYRFYMIDTRLSVEVLRGEETLRFSIRKPEYDELLPQAVDVIFDTKQASVSMLQRRLKLGYSRAARIIDQMEEMGIIGPFEGSKPRQIVITREQWLEMQTTQGTAPTEMLQTQLEFADEINSDD